MVDAEWVGRVRIAYDRAKTRTAQVALDAGGEVDPEAIGSKVEEIGDGLDHFQSVKCTSIRSTADDIEEELGDIADEVNGHLNEVRAELSKAEG